jgi:hypothetical protein
MIVDNSFIDWTYLVTFWFLFLQDVFVSDKNLRYFGRPSSSCPRFAEAKFQEYGISQLNTLL